MNLKIESTKDVGAAGVKVFCYGGSGVGKTRLCATTGDLERTMIISAEAGLLSLRDYNIPFTTVRTIDDVRNVYSWLKAEGDEGRYTWVCIDSLTEIGEVLLNTEKKTKSDPRQAYGVVLDEMPALVRAFRDLPRNIYMTAKMERTKDEAAGTLLYGPSMPGQKLGPQLPYLFDEVFCLHAYEDPETKTVERRVQTRRDAKYDCKDRSGALDAYEVADLALIAQKIGATRPPPA